MYTTTGFRKLLLFEIRFKDGIPDKDRSNFHNFFARDLQILKNKTERDKYTLQ